MRRLLVVVALFMLIHSSVSESDNEAKVVQYQYNIDEKGNYNFSFKTSNGITREESGTVLDYGLPSQYIYVRGEFTHYTPDGQKEEWMYTADKNGYHQERLLDILKVDVGVRGARVCLGVIFYAAIIVQLSATGGLEKQIKKHTFNNNGLGTYSFEFQNTDGTFRKEDGGIISQPKGSQSMVVRGEYGYLDPDGVYHYVRYIADAKGYQPQADDSDIRYNDRRIF